MRRFIVVVHYSIRKCERWKWEQHANNRVLRRRKTRCYLSQINTISCEKLPRDFICKSFVSSESEMASAIKVEPYQRFYLHKDTKQMNFRRNEFDVMMSLSRYFHYYHLNSPQKLQCFLFLFLIRSIWFLNWMICIRFFSLIKTNIFHSFQVQPSYKKPLQNVELAQRSYEVVGSKIHLYNL